MSIDGHCLVSTAHNYNTRLYYVFVGDGLIEWLLKTIHFKNQPDCHDEPVEAQTA